MTALRMRIDLSGVLLCHAEDLSEVLGPIEARFEALGVPVRTLIEFEGD